MMMSIIRSMIKTRRCFSRTKVQRERWKNNKFSLFLLLRLVYVVYDRQPTPKDEREILSSSSSLFLPFTTDERTTQTRKSRWQTRSCFSHEAVAYYSQSSFELRRAFEFYNSPRRVVRCFRSQRSPPFLSSSSSNVMKWEKKKYIRASASWKNKNTCNRTSLGDDLVVVVWINVHRGRHMWWREYY